MKLDKKESDIRKIKLYLLKEIPALKNILDIHKLGTGASHLNYLITTPKNKIVLRKDIDKSTKGKLKREYLALKAIKKLDIAPIPLYFQQSSKIGSFILLKYVEGIPLNKGNYKLSLSVIKKLAREVAELHSVPVFSLRKRLPLEFHKPSSYLKEIRAYKKQLKPYVKSKKFFLWIDEMYYRFNSLSKNFKFQYGYCLIHSDIQEQNIIIQNNKMKLIDWESAMISDPATEVSYILTQFGEPFTQRQKDQFIDEYLKNKKDTSLKERVEFYIPLRFFLDFLWSILQTGKIKKGILYYSDKNKRVINQRKYTRVCLKRLIKSSLIDKIQGSFLEEL